jgi:hypothetical protein
MNYALQQETIKQKNPARKNRVLEGGDEWARTTDTRIFSPMLYQLSYITFFYCGTKV